jgi:hypothetical protein
LADLVTPKGLQRVAKLFGLGNDTYILINALNMFDQLAVLRISDSADVVRAGVILSKIDYKAVLAAFACGPNVRRDDVLTAYFNLCNMVIDSALRVLESREAVILTRMVIDAAPKSANIFAWNSTRPNPNRRVSF